MATIHEDNNTPLHLDVDGLGRHLNNVEWDIPLNQFGNADVLLATLKRGTLYSKTLEYLKGATPSVSALFGNTDPRIVQEFRDLASGEATIHGKVLDQTIASIIGTVNWSGTNQGWNELSSKVLVELLLQGRVCVYKLGDTLKVLPRHILNVLLLDTPYPTGETHIVAYYNHDDLENVSVDNISFVAGWYKQFDDDCYNSGEGLLSRNLNLFLSEFQARLEVDRTARHTAVPIKIIKDMVAQVPDTLDVSNAIWVSDTGDVKYLQATSLEELRIRHASLVNEIKEVFGIASPMNSHEAPSSTALQEHNSVKIGLNTIIARKLSDFLTGISGNLVTVEPNRVGALTSVANAFAIAVQSGFLDLELAKSEFKKFFNVV